MLTLPFGWRLQEGVMAECSRPLEYAIRYADLGWPVFPCRPGDKRPATKNGLHDATTDRDTITDWWSRTPALNVAVATGLGFDVLDIDQPDGKKADGCGSLARLIHQHHALEVGPIALTPSGGAHYLFAPTGRGNSAGRLPGIDWRGIGGYVVVAPSIVGGVAYEWLDPIGSPPDAPVWLLEAVTSTPRTAGLRPTSGGTAGGRYLGLVGTVAVAVEGERNTMLHWAACRLAEHRDKGEDIRSAVDALHTAAVRAGLDDREVEKTIRSALGGA
jgi:hypothetical protein